MSAADFRRTIFRLGLTQAEVSRALGVDPAVISRICCGMRPTDSMVKRLLAIDPARWRGKVRMGRPRKVS